MLRASSEGPSFATEEFMGKLVLGVVTLALSAGTASAADLAAPGYGYGAPAYTPPAYGYAAPMVAPGQAGTTIVIVTPAPAYTTPPVTAGYYAPHPVPPEPIYDTAPGYGYGYTPGFWGGYGYGWR